MRFCIVVIALIVSWPAAMSGQQEDSVGVFLSLHGSAFWSTSGMQGGFFGDGVRGGFGGGIGYRRSANLATLVQFTYYPAVTGLHPTPVLLGDPGSHLPLLMKRDEMHGWLVNIGVEYRLLSFGPATIAGDVGAVAGLTIDETRDLYGREKIDKMGVFGFFLGPVVMVKITETPLTGFVTFRYQYAPSWNSLETDDNSGIPLMLGLRCDL
jgi:hypothetical protein